MALAGGISFYTELIGRGVLVLKARFHLLSWLRFAPAPVPKWAQGVGLDMLFFQPSTFDTASSDMIVLDRRARERLGYEPVWDTPQTIKWCTDVVEASKASGAVCMLMGLSYSVERSKLFETRHELKQPWFCRHSGNWI